MSGFSGPTHQGLVGDPIPTHKKKTSTSKSEPKDDVEDNTPESDMDGVENRKQIDAGMEALVMLAANDKVISDAIHPAQQEIIDAVRKQLIAFAANNGNPAISEDDLDDGNESLAQFKETMSVVIKKIAQITMIFLSSSKEALKKISGRLNRLTIRNAILRRRVDNSGDKLSNTNDIPLPETHPYITIKGKTPKTAGDVSHAVVCMKDFFVCTHNTNSAFYNAFSQAVSNGTRDDAIYAISQYLGLLSNRVGAKANSESKMIYDNIPAGYGMVIKIGNSFSDCSANVTRVQDQKVSSPTTQRGDKASLLNILDNTEQFLKNINEVYGRISSRLEGEFRKQTRAAEAKLRGNDDYDKRAMNATMEWFGTNHTAIFTKTMQMGCSVLSAAMDYVYNSVVKPGAGTEDLDGDSYYDEEDEMVKIVNPPLSLDETRVGLAVAEVHARALSAIPGEVMVVDRTMERLMSHTSSGAPLVISKSINGLDLLFGILDNSDDEYLVDVSGQILELREGLSRLINTKREVYSYGLLKGLVVQDVKEGWSYEDGLLFNCGSPRLDYDRFGLRIRDQVLKPCEEIYTTLKTHFRMLSDSFNREDILLSNLLDKLTTASGALATKPVYLTGSCVVNNISREFGDVILPSYAMSWSSSVKGDVNVAPSVPSDIDFRSHIDSCIELYNRFGALHAEYTDLYYQINNVFNIIVTSLLTAQDRSWVRDAFTYLSILIGTVRWLTRLHNDTMDYLLSLSKQMLVKSNEATEEK